MIYYSQEGHHSRPSWQDGQPWWPFPQEGHHCGNVRKMANGVGHVRRKANRSGHLRRMAKVFGHFGKMAKKSAIPAKWPKNRLSSQDGQSFWPFWQNCQKFGYPSEMAQKLAMLRKWLRIWPYRGQNCTTRRAAWKIDFFFGPQRVSARVLLIDQRLDLKYNMVVSSNHKLFLRTLARNDREPTRPAGTANNRARRTRRKQTPT